VRVRRIAPPRQSDVAEVQHQLKQHNLQQQQQPVLLDGSDEPVSFSFFFSF
jgi:hypothetical protein